jgi:hypothetical protein
MPQRDGPGGAGALDLQGVVGKSRQHVAELRLVPLAEQEKGHPQLVVDAPEKLLRGAGAAGGAGEEGAQPPLTAPGPEAIAQHAGL